MVSTQATLLFFRKDCLIMIDIQMNQIHYLFEGENLYL